MNQDLKLLLELQEIDKVITRHHADLESLPAKIEEKRTEISQAARALAQTKGQFTAVQLDKKNKEIELSTQEENIRKHEKELNSVKTNEAYKALLSEIDQAKKMTSEIEDQILTLMEDNDRLVKQMKVDEENVKSVQHKLELEIKENEDQINKVKLDLESENKKREDFAPHLHNDLLKRYDFIRNKKKSLAIVPISGESCTGCNTALTQSTLNEVKKMRELISCESCARIIYFTDHQTVPS